MAVPTTPYTYLVGWSHLNRWYYGVRYAQGCSPADLWNPYKTSSKVVANFIQENGDPDVIEVRRVFDTRLLMTFKASKHKESRSQRLKLNNPMKNPETIKRMLETRRLNKELKNVDSN